MHVVPGQISYTITASEIKIRRVATKHVRNAMKLVGHDSIRFISRYAAPSREQEEQVLENFFLGLVPNTVPAEILLVYPLRAGIRSSNMMAKWLRVSFQLRRALVHRFEASLTAM